MRKVGIRQLKDGLSRYLRAVRRGATLTVFDRGVPIARIVPFGQEGGHMIVRYPCHTSPPLHRIPLPPPLKVDVDVVALLADERGAR